MDLMLKVTKYALGVLIIGLILAVVAGLGWRAYVQSSVAERLEIDSERGVDEGRYVDIGDTRQWLQIRGQDYNKPIVLLLNGGPGASWLRATSVLQPWEEDFVFVQWDQRGAGRSFAHSGPGIGPTMNIERMVQDGLEVVEHVTRYLDQEKVILLGHSWGSMMGVEMIRRRPELFHAYIGTAQIGDLDEDLNRLFTDIENSALDQGDRQAQSRLIGLGRPPYENYQDYLRLFQLRAEVLPDYEPEAASLPYSGLAAPDYSLMDYYHLSQGMQLSMNMLYPEMVHHDLVKNGELDVEVPFFIMHGAQDHQTPIASARRLFEQVDAPYKNFFEFPESGHFLFLETDKFLQVVRERIMLHVTR